MAITRFTYRNPWQEFDQLTNRLGQLFSHDMPTPANGVAWQPAVNVEESGDELVLTAEVPGMNRDDIDIQLENNVLTISGERAEERTEGEEGKRFHLWERRYGSFQRSFTLPRTVGADAQGSRGQEPQDRGRYSGQAGARRLDRLIRTRTWGGRGAGDGRPRPLIRSHRLRSSSLPRAQRARPPIRGSRLQAPSPAPARSASRRPDGPLRRPHE
jgi:HSP20 family protein